MSPSPEALPQLLARPSTRRLPGDFARANLERIRKAARVWLGADRSKLPKEPLVKALRQAMEDDAAADRVLKALSPDERAAVAAYRRYGGTVDGEVIRLDLMARGLVEVVETRVTDYYTQRRWKRNPVKDLSERWVLLADDPDRDEYYYYGGYGDETSRPFGRYSLHAGLAGHVEPAGPPPWSVAPAEGVAHAITGRSPAEVALDLARVFAFVAARGSVKVRKDGVPALPTLRAMEKAVPLGDDPEFALPEPHGLAFELLRYSGAIRVEGNAAVADPAEAVRMTSQPDAWQAYSWAQGWLRARHWSDGLGTPESSVLDDEEGRVLAGRRVVAWALGCLAHAGDHWYDLDTFLDSLLSLQGEVYFPLPLGNLAWEPKRPPHKGKGKPDILATRRAGGTRRAGAWHANAVMVTLVALGLVERGRMGRGDDAPHAFRLTGLGRAVFGAPDIAPPPAAGERRFLVVQPNFDVLAYVDQADASSAGLLGRMAESDSTHSGPVRTFRLTQSSVYRAEEGGLGHDQIVAFLQGHAQGTLPPNVVRSIADWTGKRESLALRSGITLLGFPSEAARDAHLKAHPDGTPCGERFVLATGRGKAHPVRAGALASVSHLEGGRRTLSLDEHGNIKAGQPTDIVQRSRLRRIAVPTLMGWRLTSDSIGRASAAGLKRAQVHRWLSDHLAHAIPPLIAHAIDAWMGKSEPLELADAILLHVPDDASFRAIAASRRLKPFLIGSTGPRFLLVKRESRKELTAALEELGFTIGRELNLKDRD